MNLSEVMRKIETETEAKVARGLDSIIETHMTVQLVIGNNETRSVFYTNGRMEEENLLAVLYADLKKTYSIFMSSADKQAIKTAIAEIEKEHPHMKEKRIVLPTHLYNKLRLKNMYDKYVVRTQAVARPIVDMVSDVMSEGAKEFEKEVGRPMTYSEMRAMYG